MTFFPCRSQAITSKILSDKLRTDTAFRLALSHSSIKGCRKMLCLIACSTFLFLQIARAQRITQPIRFKEGQLTGQGNLLTTRLNPDSLHAVLYQKKVYLLLQFDRLPGAAERAALSSLGIRLFDYIPGNAFLAELPEDFSTDALKGLGVSGAYILPQPLKISAKLLEDSGLDTDDPGYTIAVSFFGTIPRTDVIAEIAQTGAEIVSTKIQPAHTVFVRADGPTRRRLAALPFVSYLGLQSMKPRMLNYNNRAAHGLDALGATAGRNLQGQNVTIGIGDNADPYTHIDFTGRLIDRCPDSADLHGTHTTGTAAGGGILDPRYKGMAPQATIVSQSFTDIISNAPIYITDYDMVLTSNSYTDALNGCPGEGEYDALSNYLDTQLDSFPHLMHDFAAGNDGFYTCSPYPSYFGTIKSGLQSAKNIISVGDLDNSTYLIDGSSRGPENDGRIKPELVAGGTLITSTLPYNTYGAETGTSMSSPTVTGTLALLYQRYRQLHGGLDPTAALIKAIACNSATDLGNPGPDFTYGFGMLNALTAVQTIENNQYFSGTLVNNGNATFTISGVPAGTQQVKIMLYWSDPAAAPFAATTLVNNLDLTVVSPDAIVHHPMVLNSNPANVNDNAVEGVDSLNNIEQVVINTPPGGSFTVKVAGTAIPGGSQDFVIAYQIIQPSVSLQYPFGNETWVPGDAETIRWNAYGGDPNTFTLEYSPDNGSTWNTISNAVPATTRLYPWTVPAAATNTALIRVTCNTTGYSNVSNYPFTILGQPSITVTNPCQGYAQIDWSAIPSATSYDIMELRGDTMQVVANTTATSYLLGKLSRDSSYWLSVRAVNGSSPGRRSIAANVQPGGGTCALSALDNDLSVDSLIAPHTGRMFSSSQLTATTPVSVEIKNLGTIPTSGSYSLSYQVNGGAIVTEPVSAVIAAGAAFDYTFTNTYDFSAVGAYTLQVWVSYPGDPQPGNDTITTVIKQLQNDPLVLSPAYTEGFESAAAQTCTSATMGLQGLDRCDFAASTTNGRARTFINSGFARTGSRCLTLDQSHFMDNSSTDSLVTTFNLSGYSSADQIWLDFYYQNQGIDFTLPGNQVWIRGNDQAAWLPVYTLNATPASIGGYQPSAHIDVTATLAAATPVQSVGSSFQVKFGEQGFTSTNSVVQDGDLDDGYSFDDVTLTRSSNDMGILSLVAPMVTGVCNLSAAEPITVKVKNYSNSTATNIPVSYSINGGTTVTESIPSIGAFDSITYTFTQKANLSASQGYVLQTWVSYPGDNYHQNDTLPAIQFQTGPLISSFPYLEGFEADNGNWFTGGINDSWQWGTPAKTIINKAANGTKCWVTNLTGNYNDNELSYLYSPCFDLSGLQSPVLSFSHIFQTEDDCDCDYHWAEYSTDGVNWNKLGTVDSGTNWYDNPVRIAWQLSYTQWHVSSYAIPTHGSKVRFRIVMSSDPGTTYEGVGIDDVHIFDRAPVYSGPTISSGLTQPVSGNNWVDFSSGGNRVVSLNPNGQDLGITNVGVFINSGPVRNDGQQYYLDRNVVIQPANPPTGNVSVRYYFLDTEAQNLVNAAASGSCGTCTTIPDAYQAGVMQYSSPVLSEEDSTLANDSSGTFHFLAPHKDVSIIPYDNGYYAEYQVGGFSEFWINSGTPGQNQPYPFALLSFTAARSAGGALLQWSTTEEMNTSRFVIQRSSDAVSFQALDSVKAIGDSNTVNNYQYTDAHLLNGINYYRLKMIANDGSFKFSPVRSVDDTLSPSLVIHLYPNPVIAGSLYVSTTVNCRQIRVTDALGRIVRIVDTHGLFNTLFLGDLAKGIYFVTVLTDSGNTVQKVLIVK